MINYRRKKIILIGTMVTSFLLMFDTKYLRAPGDYLLEFFGLKSWTGELSGTHLTVIYFGIVFFVSLFLIEKHLINEYKMKWRNVIIILIFSIALYSSTVGTIVQIIMRNSDTLTSIEYQSEVGQRSFDKDNGEYTSFDVVFKLNNKSRDKRKFYVDFNSSWRREDGESSIKVLDKNGERAVFELAGEASEIFELDEKDYILIDDDQEGNYSSSGILDEIILTDLDGYSIVLQHDRGYSLKINR